jgi:hypothetical protein
MLTISEMARPTILTEENFQSAARSLKCDPATIKAVAEVESNGHGFLSDGNVKVSFEGHQFYKYTKGHYQTQYPAICYPQ